MNYQPLVPISYYPPISAHLDHITLRQLTLADVVTDYDVVMSNRNRLKGMFWFDESWPKDTHTIEQNLIDISWHIKEFQIKSTYTYCIIDNFNKKYVGCLYFFNPRMIEYDVDIYLWVDHNIHSDKVKEYYISIIEWINNEWPFKKINLIAKPSGTNMQI